VAAIREKLQQMSHPNRSEIAIINRR